MLHCAVHFTDTTIHGITVYKKNLLSPESHPRSIKSFSFYSLYRITLHSETVRPLQYGAETKEKRLTAGREAVSNARRLYVVPGTGGARQVISGSLNLQHENMSSKCYRWIYTQQRGGNNERLPRRFMQLFTSLVL